MGFLDARPLPYRTQKCMKKISKYMKAYAFSNHLPPWVYAYVICGRPLTLMSLLSVIYLFNSLTMFIHSAFDGKSTTSNWLQFFLVVTPSALKFIWDQKIMSFYWNNGSFNYVTSKCTLMICSKHLDEI